MPNKEFLEASQVLDTFMTNPAFERALEKASASLPNVHKILESLGAELPQGAEITVRLTFGAEEAGSAVQSEGARKKCRTCWEVCVGPPWARVCREKCTWQPC